jgi:hypothetical protein
VAWTGAFCQADGAYARPRLKEWRAVLSPAGTTLSGTDVVDDEMVSPQPFLFLMRRQD